MDIKELQETRCCSKCLNCFDEYDHYKCYSMLPRCFTDIYMPIPPDDQPHADDLRYYCNKEHKYVLPHSIKECFTER